MDLYTLHQRLNQSRSGQRSLEFSLHEPVTCIWYEFFFVLCVVNVHFNWSLNNCIVSFGHSNENDSTNSNSRPNICRKTSDQEYVLTSFMILLRSTNAVLFVYLADVSRRSLDGHELKYKTRKGCMNDTVRQRRNATVKVFIFSIAIVPPTIDRSINGIIKITIPVYNYNLFWILCNWKSSMPIYELIFNPAGILCHKEIPYTTYRNTPTP